jgi:glycogen debranching enzyme
MKRTNRRSWKRVRSILFIAAVLVGSALPRVTTDAAAASPQARRGAIAEQELARQLLTDPDFDFALERAEVLLGSGLTAGSGYGEVWIRDLNTFLEMTLRFVDRGVIRSNLLTFFKFQGPDGNIPDGFIPEAKGSVGYQYRRSELAPGLLAHKNTVETDQETSLIQAIRRYVGATGDRGILDERVGEMPVRERLRRALEYLYAERFDRAHGLIWGATTVDWGDVQPEHPWGVELDESSHQAIDVYDNAMLLIAIADYVELVAEDRSEVKRWRKAYRELRAQVRRHLWDGKRQQFVPHIYLEGSPFPADFDEASIYYHGGTAVAIEAGLLSRSEIEKALARMRDNVRRAGASSIGLTVYPPYPDGLFKNPGMKAWSYQNGGDWCWFGGRMIQQLVRHGMIEDAYRELKPMVARVRQHGDFHEWWSRDNQPRGSAQFRGSAGVLGQAIFMLRDWAHRQSKAG